MNLYQVTSMLFVVQVSGVFYSGTKSEARVFLRTKGVREEEVTLAFAEFHQKGHNRANFGVNGDFIFSTTEEDIELLLPCKGAA